MSPISTAANNASIEIFVTKYSASSLGSNAFSPPLTAALADWSSSGFSKGEQRLAIWSTNDGYDSTADTVLIGVRPVSSDVDLTITATALSAFPVSYSGTLTTPGGVSASAIRAGGLRLAVSLSCDAFVDPGPA